jgi:hypothetical protein
MNVCKDKGHKWVGVVFKKTVEEPQRGKQQGRLGRSVCVDLCLGLLSLVDWVVACSLGLLTGDAWWTADLAGCTCSLCGGHRVNVTSSWFDCRIYRQSNDLGVGPLLWGLCTGQMLRFS